MGDNFVAEAVDPLLEKYKKQAITAGTQALILQAVVFGVIVFVIFDDRLRKYRR